MRLGSNKLGEASGVAFGRALGRAPSLRALHLPQNSLGAKAGEALVGGAEANGAVMAVAVEGNLIPYATLIRLEERLGANRKRARDERPMRLTAKVRELERTAEALRAARAELAALRQRRAAAERRQRVLGASLESERQALLAAKADGASQRRLDADAVDAAARGAKGKRAELEEKRLKWHSTLEALRRRKAQEETRVRSLSEALGRELRELSDAEGAVRQRLEGMEGRLEEAEQRAEAREVRAEEVMAELRREAERIEAKPQLRKLLSAPRPTRPGSPTTRSSS